MTSRGLGRFAAELLAYLSLFARAPESERPDCGPLRNHLIGALDRIAERAAGASIDTREVDEARFALAAWADEVILATDWRGVDEWRKGTLQLLLFDTVKAGNEFYERLARLGSDAVEAREVYFLCLAMGFQGQHAGSCGERKATIDQTYAALCRAGRALPAHEPELLSHAAYDWEFDPGRARRPRVWPRLAALALVLFALYGAFHLVLRNLAAEVPTAEIAS